MVTAPPPLWLRCSRLTTTSRVFSTRSRGNGSEKKAPPESTKLVACNFRVAKDFPAQSTDHILFVFRKIPVRDRSAGPWIDGLTGIEARRRLFPGRFNDRTFFNPQPLDFGAEFFNSIGDFFTSRSEALQKPRTGRDFIGSGFASPVRLTTWRKFSPGRFRKIDRQKHARNLPPRRR